MKSACDFLIQFETRKFVAISPNSHYLQLARLNLKLVAFSGLTFPW
jgi:hypothetical protein